MTVGDLKKALARHPDDMTVSISIETPSGFMCPDGAVCDVNSVGCGIDWHGHEFMIYPKYELRLRDDSVIERWSRRQ